MLQRELDGGSAPRECTDIKVEELIGSSENLRGIGISPYHYYTGLRGVMLE